MTRTCICDPVLFAESFGVRVLQQVTMAACSRYSLYWEETDCLSYYEMLSLHEIFEIVGSQLTQTDCEVLSFLLDEDYPARHPLDPEYWTADVSPDSDSPVNSPCPHLLEAWRRIRPREEPSPFVSGCRPKSGVTLLLELERRGFLNEANLEPLLQLLRILTRHDLLPFVSSKKRRTVSPERAPVSNVESREHIGISSLSDLQKTQASQWKAGVGSAVTTSALARRRGRRGKGRGRAKKARETSEIVPQPAQNKVTCDIRLRVRAEYSEHESALRARVASDKQQPLERQFELFSRANLLLRARDLGSIVCDIKFSELQNLDAFWADYLSGALLEALKGVFITDSLKRAAGQEGVRLLVSVDQDDYEEGRKLLLNNQTHSTACGPVHSDERYKSDPLPIASDPRHLSPRIQILPSQPNSPLLSPHRPPTRTSLPPPPPSLHICPVPFPSVSSSYTARLHIYGGHCCRGVDGKADGELIAQNTACVPLLHPQPFLSLWEPQRV
ncbi:Death effector domain-containing protein [Bagarius yarrelli]|uniref:Death effector domain-containing protein n=1 Tax=Bagarius yarrelli TaxID=175774 RepID=A0A556V165_BAGYA|nr:Death effector domain-containing protein [Bagarius yarrelli]